MCTYNLRSRKVSELKRSKIKVSELNVREDLLRWTRYPLVFPNNISKGKSHLKKNSNLIEKKWGNMINSKLFKKNKFTVNWTTFLGEQLLKKTLEESGIKVYKPKIINGYKPDWESDEAIYEVKTRNWTTTGTAGEKVLGTPYKYSDVPRLYNKPLKIVCIAYQEYELTHGNTRIFGNKISAEKKKLLDTFKKLDISFVKFSDLIKSTAS